MTEQTRIVLSKQRGDEPTRDSLQQRLVVELTARLGVSVNVLPHLYDMAPDGPGMQGLRETDGDLVLLSWLYPRAAYWTLSANRVAGRLGPTSSIAEEEIEAPTSTESARPERTIWCLDLRDFSKIEPCIAEVATLLGIEPVDATATSGETAAEAAPGTSRIAEATQPRWYPVIDYGRCTNCLECLNFCLFGVFDLDETESILVDQPDACRDGCPACSRICPAGAIMFPEHDAPAIAGDPEASRGGLKLDLSQIFGGMNLAEMAEAERRRALQEQAVAGGDQKKRPQTPKSQRTDRGGNGELDDLVDEIDDLDL
jgi:hypothetical protein